MYSLCGSVFCYVMFVFVGTRYIVVLVVGVCVLYDACCYAVFLSAAMLCYLLIFGVLGVVDGALLLFVLLHAVACCVHLMLISRLMFCRAMS